MITTRQVALEELGLSCAIAIGKDGTSTSWHIGKCGKNNYHPEI